MKTLSLTAISVLLVLSACGSQFGGRGKNESKRKDDDQEVATLICLKNSEDCAILTCDEILALEADGKIHDDNRDDFADALAICKHRRSSHDQDPTQASDDSSSNDSDDGSQNHSDDDDCP